ncbi:MAG: carbohydrate transporter substrate-binding protein family [Clostridia bacterium]|nr:carbohydrate transporter substrate-binding protein family [Clostridia bacterium]
MRKNNANFKKLVCLAVLMIVMTACRASETLKGPLDPDHPVTVTLWNYYNGAIKEQFDQLVLEFNDTVGMEKGIVVDAFSQGDVQQLADAVFDAANNKIGSRPLPHIFAAYPDNAYRIESLIGLVDMEEYFSKEELGEFRQDFLQEGRFGEDHKLKIIPVAKATENLFLNKTHWDAFALDTGADIKGLSTWEGIIKIAEDYYRWTDEKTIEPNDGQAFLGIDSLSNYILLASVQLGEELYDFENETVVLKFDKEIARKVWDSLYVPYFKGYYAKVGRFASDDAKTGIVIGYIGSTAGAGYFPNEVTVSQMQVYPIRCKVLPYPYFKEGERYAVQQGAGMCITKSDEAHEYAAAEFLKWFIAKEQNIDFAASTGYFPVKTEALDEQLILAAQDEAGRAVSNAAIIESIKSTVKMLDEYALYGNRPFEGSYDMRKFLETTVFDQVEKDLQTFEMRIEQGEDYEMLREEFISEKNFNKWYEQFLEETDRLLR